MKTLFITFITIFFGVINMNIQDKTIIEVTYDGYYGGVYSFTTITDDEDDFGETIEFIEISKEILKKFDLKSEDFIDEEFTITYIEEVVIEDEEEIVINKLIDIKQ